MTTYVLTDGAGHVITYPYNVAILRRDNLDTSFPPVMSLEDLAQFNVFPVTPTVKPNYNFLTQDLVESYPTKDCETWKQVWVVKNVSSRVSEARINQAIDASKSKANDLLQASNQYVIEAFETSKTLSAEFQAYRAALRNISEFSEDPFIIVFPSMPERIFVEIADLPEDFEDNL